MTLISTILTGLCLNISSCNVSEHDLSAPRKTYYQTLADQLQHETIRITTLSNEPLSGYRRENDSFIGTGVAFDIIHILQMKFKFNYTFYRPTGNEFYSNGSANSVSAVENMLLKNVTDIVAAFLPPTYNSDIKYSKCLESAEWVVLMKRPKESATGSGLLAPFATAVWILIIISIFIVGPVLYFIVLIRNKLCGEKNPNNAFTLSACMWFVYGALLKQGSTLNPKTDSSRLLFSTWWIFITILTAFYTANLTAFLTLSKFTLPINSPEDIGKKRYGWVTNTGNGILYNKNNYSITGIIGTPMHIVSDTETILQRYVTRSNLMYIRERPILEFLMYEDYKRKTKANLEESKRCTYVISTFPVTTMQRAFAFAPHFKYFELFDNTIQHLMESGIVDFKQREMLPDTTICPLNLGNKERQLRNSDLNMTYMIVGGGLVTSTIIFLAEIISKFCRQKNILGENNINPNNKIKVSRWLRDTANPGLQGEEKPYSYSFKTPPPSYNTLFQTLSENINNKEKKFEGEIAFIPHVASITLFQFTK